MAKRQRRYGNNSGLNAKTQEKTSADKARKPKKETTDADAPQSQQGPSSGIVTYEDVKKKYRFYFNIVAKRKIWFLISTVLVAASVAALAIWNLNYGMAFTGGTMVSLTFDTPVTQQDISDVASSVGINAQIQIIGDTGDRQVIIRTSASEEEHVAMLAAIRENWTYDPLSVEESLVGPSIGAELQRSAISALVLACALMLGYLAIRFKFKYAVSGVIALLHDVLITVGVFAVLQWQIDPPFIAAILTVFGYSINDKVVIFDRIRENEEIQKKRDSFENLVDQSLWQTMARSINTGLVVLLALFAIFLLGGETTKTFSLAMIIGAIVGMYSSIFLASQLIVELKRAEKGKKQKELKAS
jgi:preprotein translocase SecF subunit